jgi:hypothetical protein
MMSGVLLETCWAFIKRWNNKFYYKLHLVGISTELYYDAWIHEYQIYKTKSGFCACAITFQMQFTTEHLTL